MKTRTKICGLDEDVSNAVLILKLLEAKKEMAEDDRLRDNIDKIPPSRSPLSSRLSHIWPLVPVHW